MAAAYDLIVNFIDVVLFCLVSTLLIFYLNIDISSALGLPFSEGCMINVHN